MDSEELNERENSRLAIESAKLDKDEEQAIADVGLATDFDEEPEY